MVAESRREDGGAPSSEEIGPALRESSSAVIRCPSLRLRSLKESRVFLSSARLSDHRRGAPLSAAAEGLVLVGSTGATPEADDPETGDDAAEGSGVEGSTLGDSALGDSAPGDSALGDSGL